MSQSQYRDGRMENAHYWAAQALGWMKNGPNAGIDGGYYVEIIGGRPVVVLDAGVFRDESTVKAVKDGLRGCDFPLPIRTKKLDSEWRLFVMEPNDDRLVCDFHGNWRAFESQRDFSDTDA